MLLDPDTLEAARRAIQRASAILHEADFADAPEIIDRARAAMAELEAVEQLAGGRKGPAPSGKGAKGRILAYFLDRGVDGPVAGPELRRISGIQEWARRVRELRVEEGWDIRYDGKFYRLNSAQPNREVAEAWRLANEIRKTSLSGGDRILRYLQARVGEVVTAELINYVAGTQREGSFIDELRSDLGYPISTSVDRPDLGPDEYVLESIEPSLGPAERRASATLRKTVFERDGYRCVLCGLEYGSDVRLLPHRLDQNAGDDSDSDPESFVSLCQKDHASLTGEQTQQLLKRRRRRIGG